MQPSEKGKDKNKDAVALIKSVYFSLEFLNFSYEECDPYSLKQNQYFLEFLFCL